MDIKKVIVFILVLVAVVLIAWYLMGQFEQTKPIADQMTAFGNQAQTYVTANLPTVVAAGGTLTTIGGVALSKINSAKATASAAQAQLTQISSDAQTKIDSLTQQKTALETPVSQLQNTPTPEVDTGLITQYEQQITSLKGQVQAGQDQTTSFVKSLMSAANGALVTGPDGKIYSVLKVPPEVIVK